MQGWEAVSMRFFMKSFGVENLSAAGSKKPSLFVQAAKASLLQRECEADSFSWFMEALMQDLTL